MKRIRIVGLCLVAVFALAGLTASSALAGSGAGPHPSYKLCKQLKVKPLKGHYTDKKCEHHATAGEEAEGKKNKYEWGEFNEGKEAQPAFKGKNGVSTLTSYVKGFGIVGAVTCAKAKSEGKITSAKGGVVTVVFEKCTSSGESCASAGEAAGKIKTEELATELIDTAESATGVATRVSGQPVSAAFKCGAEEVKTTGTADGEDLGNVETLVKKSKQNFAVNAGGEQVINNGGADVLLTEVKGVGTFESGENTASELSGKEEMEIEL